MERLQKVLAQAGIASRRKCEEIILSGRVAVNDKPVTELGVKVDPEQDQITVDGRPIHFQSHVYVLFHKPKGVITSVSDPQGRRVVNDYLKGIKARIYPVGRLDYDTEGLLLLTNDGELAHMLAHPKYEVEKTYYAEVKGVPHGTELDKLRQGIELDDGMTAPAEVEYVDVDPDGKYATISITIKEGRNRQIRRMFDAIKHPVQKLRRVQYGNLTLAGVPRGKYRMLKPQEVNELRQMVRTHKFHKADETK